MVQYDQTPFAQQIFVIVSDLFLYFRCWPGFTRPFPFERFKGLRDTEIHQALEEFAKEYLQKNKFELLKARRARKQALRSGLEKRQRQFTNPPIASVGTVEKPPLQRLYLADLVRGLPRSAPLILRLGRYAGWFNGPATLFGHGIGPTIWFLCTSSEDFATQLIKELSKLVSPDFEGIPSFYIEYGWKWEKTFTLAESASIRFAIEQLKNELLWVECPELIFAIGTTVRLVATKLAKGWVEAVNSHAGSASIEWAATSAPLGTTATDKKAKKRRRPRVSREEWNERAREALKNPKFRTVRALAKAIGCGPSQVSGLPAWKAYRERVVEMNPPKAKIKAASPQVEASGTEDSELQKLIREQTGDLQNDNVLTNRGRTRRK